MEEEGEKGGGGGEEEEKNGDWQDGSVHSPCKSDDLEFQDPPWERIHSQRLYSGLHRYAIVCDQKYMHTYPRAHNNRLN